MQGSIFYNVWIISDMFRIARSCSLIQTQEGPSTLMEILFVKNAHNDDGKTQLSQNDCTESHLRQRDNIFCYLLNKLLPDSRSIFLQIMFETQS